MADQITAARLKKRLRMDASEAGRSSRSDVLYSSPRNARRKTLPLPTEIICQILSGLVLYDRRSFALCSRTSYRVASETLFGDVFLGRNAGTMIAADGIFRSGAPRQGNKAKQRRWAGRLSTKSILLLKDKGTLRGDVEFLSGNGRIMRAVRHLHIGLPPTSSWNIADPNSRFACKVNPDLLATCLSGLPTLHKVSLYAPTPSEPHHSGGGYEGLDVRLFHYILSQFNGNDSAKEYDIVWWPRVSRAFSHKSRPFLLPNGEQLLPDGLTDADPHGTMDIDLYGPMNATSISLNLLPAQYPVCTAAKEDYTEIYSTLHSWKRTNGGRTPQDQKTYQLHMPRIIYSLIIPSCLTSTLTTLELKVDTCPCCCVNDRDHWPYFIIAQVQDAAVDDVSTANFYASLPMGFFRSAASLEGGVRPPFETSARERYGLGRIRPEEAARRFNVNDMAGAKLRSFSYQGPRCTRTSPGPSWLNYAASTWASTLEHLSIIETEYPHAGAERGEKYGRGPSSWDFNLHVPALLRLKKLRSLRMCYSMLGDKRDAEYLKQAYMSFGNDGQRRADVGRDFADPTTPLNSLINAVVNAAAARAIATLPRPPAQLRPAARTDRDASATSSGPSTPPVLAPVQVRQLPPTPLEAGRRAYYRSGRKRRIREMKKFVVHMSSLESVEWVMHGVRARYRDFDEEEGEVDPEDAVRDDKEIALAETVALRMRITWKNAGIEEENGQGTEEVEIVPDGVEGMLGSLSLSQMPG